MIEQLPHYSFRERLSGLLSMAHKCEAPCASFVPHILECISMTTIFVHMALLFCWVFREHTFHALQVRTWTTYDFWSSEKYSFICIIIEMMFEQQWGDPSQTPHKYKSTQHVYIYWIITTQLSQGVMTVIKVTQSESCIVYVKLYHTCNILTNQIAPLEAAKSLIHLTLS